MRPYLPVLAAAILLSGCGYPGDPRPPALNRPERVVDLAAVQRGAQVFVHFTVPTLTTEGLPVKDPEIELRVGPMPEGRFDFAAWIAGSVQVPAPEIHRSGTLAEAHFDVSKFYNKTAVIGVRVHGPQGRDIGWSNLESLQLVPGLPVPLGLEPKNGPDSVLLEWHAAAPEFAVFRKAEDETDWTRIGAAAKPAYSDAAIEYGKTYQYFVQSIEKTGDRYAESEPSASVSFKPKDLFAPAVPSGLTAVPSSRTIELVWDRNAEKDFASYHLFRDGQKISDTLSAPAYSDRDVKPGIKYRYQVSAVDTAGNESALSEAAEAVIP